MKIRTIILALILTTFSSGLFAQEQTEVEKLNHQIIVLELKNAQLKMKLDSAYTMIAKLMIDDLMEGIDSDSPLAEDGSFNVSEEMAMAIIKDDYEFYNRDYIYKGVKLRRKTATEFWVSLEECPKSLKGNKFGWNAKVKALTVNEDGTYTFY